MICLGLTISVRWLSPEPAPGGETIELNAGRGCHRRTPIPMSPESKENFMTKNIRTLMTSLALASAALMGAAGTAAAADQWFVLGEQTIKAADPSAQIK